MDPSGLLPAYPFRPLIQLATYLTRATRREEGKIVLAFAYATWGIRMCDTCAQKIDFEEGSGSNDPDENLELARQRAANLKIGIARLTGWQGTAVKVDALAEVLGWVEEFLAVV